MMLQIPQQMLINTSLRKVEIASKFTEPNSTLAGNFFQPKETVIYSRNSEGMV